MFDSISKSEYKSDHWRELPPQISVLDYCGKVDGTPPKHTYDSIDTRVVLLVRVYSTRLRTALVVRRRRHQFPRLSCTPHTAIVPTYVTTQFLALCSQGPSACPRTRPSLPTVAEVFAEGVRLAVASNVA